MITSANLIQKLCFCYFLLLFSVQGVSQEVIKPAGSGTEESPYQIQSLNNLLWLTENSSSWNKHFIQLEDINASKTRDLNQGKGISPIGGSDVSFSGIYHGKGHVINELYINRPSQEGVGLFGNIKGNKTRIENLGLTNINFTGKMKTGGLAGIVSGASIEECFTTGNITDSVCAGGLVGVNSAADISDCYSMVSVNTETGTAGGFVGINAGKIINCYSTGKVSGAYDIGGFVGTEENRGTISGCLWDSESSGILIGSGARGLSTNEMQKNRTYLNNGWDFVFESTNGTDDIWTRYKDVNNGYPLLTWQRPFPVKSTLPDIVGEGTVNVTDRPTALDIKGDTIFASTTDPLKYTEEGTFTITWIYKSVNNKVNKQKQQIIVKAPSKRKPVSDVSVFVYPNPLGNRLHIESGNQGIDKITISDRFGKTKIEKNNLKSKDVVDVSKLETGLYTVRIETNKESFSWKVFKK